MIVKFNLSLFTCEDKNICSKVARLLLDVLEDRFLWDSDNLDSIFLPDEFNFFESNFCKQFLSVSDKEELEEKIYKIYDLDKYQTNIHKKYLKYITIGLESSELSPENAYRIFTKPSLIIVENHINDFKFLKGIIGKYANHSTRKSIYKLIEKALKNEWLIEENAGGSGGIKPTIEKHLAGRYKDIQQYKLFAIFDSDRKNSTSMKEINEKYNNLINFFKNTNKENLEFSDLKCDEEKDVIIWHILYKRELENYAPIDVILKHLEENQKHLFNNKTPEELDFIDYEDILGESVKKDFPNYFLEDWTRDKLEERCKHHKVQIELPNGTLEEVSEMELILLKIAKII